MKRLRSHFQLTMAILIMISMIGNALPAAAQDAPMAESAVTATDDPATPAAITDGEEITDVPGTPEAPVDADTPAEETDVVEPTVPATEEPVIAPTEEAEPTVVTTEEPVVAPTESAPEAAGTPEPTDSTTMASPARATLNAVGCGSAPYPAPTGNAITAINGVTANPTQLDSNWSTFTLSVTWAAPAGSQGGDFFTLPLPEEIFTNPMYFPLKDGSGTDIACASVVGGVATFVLTDNVNDLSNVSGTAHFDAWLSKTDYTEETEIPVNFAGLGTIIFTTPGDYEEPGPDEPDEHTWKSGWFSNDDQGYSNGDHALEWMIHLPASNNGFTDIVVSDTAGQNWTFACSSPWDENEVVYLEPTGTSYTTTCTPGQLTITIPSIPANTNVDIYFYAHIEAGAPGPFSNTFSASGLETGIVGDSHNIIRTTGGGDGQGDLIVTPTQPYATAGVCAEGEWTAPTVTATDGNGLTYIVSAIDLETGAYTVTATKSDYQTWSDLTGTGWTINPANAEQAIYEGVVDLNPCTEVTPVAPTVSGNVCAGGVYTPSVITVINGNGITYEVTQAVDANGDFIVTATLSGAQAWGQMPAGWTITGLSTATYAGHVDLAPCADASPGIPSVTQAICTGGALVPPTIGMTESDNVSYDMTGSPAPGATVIITATLNDGYTWPSQMPQGWSVTSDTTATYTIVFDDVACDQVLPATPLVTNATCDLGGIIDPSIDLQTTDGVEYELTGTVAPGETVIVTATLAEGKAWAEMPDGWTRINDTTATYTVVLDDAECTPVVPVTPSVTDPSCIGGVKIDPSIDIPVTPGVTYTKQGEEVPGGTVIVTATLEDGFTWGDMPEGWLLVDSTTATFTANFGDVDCELPVTPEAPETPTTPKTPEAPATPKTEQVPAKALPSTGTGTEASAHAHVATMLLASGLLALIALGVRKRQLS